MASCPSTQRRSWSGWLLAVTLTAIVGGCGSDAELPPPITDEEVAALGLTQGVAGRSAVRQGTCGPACAVGGCQVVPVDLSLRVLPPDPLLRLPTDASQTCTLRMQTSNPLVGFHMEPVTPLAEVALGGKKSYAVGLDVGAYQLVLVDDAGCGICLASEFDGGVETCSRVSVSAGGVTKTDVLLNVAVE